MEHNVIRIVPNLIAFQIPLRSKFDVKDFSNIYFGTTEKPKTRKYRG